MKDWGETEASLSCSQEAIWLGGLLRYRTVLYHQVSMTSQKSEVRREISKTSLHTGWSSKPVSCDVLGLVLHRTVLGTRQTR